MSSIESRITSDGALWFLFAATLAITASFPFVSEYWQLTLLDGISSPPDARAVVAEMTSQQKSAHAWITATLDVAYPIAYGGLFAGTALRFFGRSGRYAAIPAFAVVPTDLAEGVVQVLALTDTVDWLGAKALLTPLKMLLFFSGMGVTVAAWGTWAYRRATAAS